MPAKETLNFTLHEDKSVHFAGKVKFMTKYNVACIDKSVHFAGKVKFMTKYYVACKEDIYDDFAGNVL